MLLFLDLIFYRHEVTDIYVSVTVDVGDVFVNIARFASDKLLSENNFVLLINFAVLVKVTLESIAFGRVNKTLLSNRAAC